MSKVVEHVNKPIDIPDEIKNRTSDGVAYENQPKKGAKFEHSASFWRRQACYANWLNKCDGQYKPVDRYGIRCRAAFVDKATVPKRMLYTPAAAKKDKDHDPNQNGVWDNYAVRPLAYEDFLKWVRICKDAKVMPSEAKPMDLDGENVLVMQDVDNLDRHELYAGLCFYRYADSSARMVWQIIRHMEAFADQGISFWQCYFYGMAAKHTSVGHTFINLHSYEWHLKDLGYCLDAAYALAGKHFFDIPADERQLVANGTIISIQGIRNDINGLYLPVQSPEDILQPGWTQIFKMPNSNLRAIRKAYDQLYPDKSIPGLSNPNKKAA